MDFRSFVREYVSSMQEESPSSVFEDDAKFLIEASRKAEEESQVESAEGIISSSEETGEITDVDELSEGSLSSLTKMSEPATDPATFSIPESSVDTPDAEAAMPEEVPAAEQAEEVSVSSSGMIETEESSAVPAEPLGVEESAPMSAGPSSDIPEPSSIQGDPGPELPDIFIPESGQHLEAEASSVTSSVVPDATPEPAPLLPSSPEPRELSVPRSSSVLSAVPSSPVKDDVIMREWSESVPKQPEVPESLAPVFNEMVEQAEAEIPPDAFDVDIRDESIELPPLPQIPSEVISSNHPVEDYMISMMQMERR